MDSFFCNSIGKNKELNTMLMHECDIYFYEQLQDVQFSENQETYSMLCRACLLYTSPSPRDTR